MLSVLSPNLWDKSTEIEALHIAKFIYFSLTFFCAALFSASDMKNSYLFKSVIGMIVSSKGLSVNILFCFLV